MGPSNSKDRNKGEAAPFAERCLPLADAVSRGPFGGQGTALYQMKEEVRRK
jgi:hypothetical protein